MTAYRHGFTSTVLSIVLTSWCAQALATPADDKPTIESAYHTIDAAYGRADLDGFFAYCSADFSVTDRNGNKHQLAELRSLMSHNWRRPENARFVARRAATKIDSIEIDGNRAIVRGTVDAELALIDTMGTAADGHDVTTFEDDWTKTPSGWTLTHETVAGFTRTVRATPSQQAQAANALIRQNTREMMDFNASINFGDCMNSASMQKYNDDDRRRRCQR